MTVHAMGQAILCRGTPSGRLCVMLLKDRPFPSAVCLKNGSESEREMHEYCAESDWANLTSEARKIAAKPAEQV